MAGTEFPERARLDNPNGAQVVQRNLEFLRDKFDGYSIPAADGTTRGGIKLAGDLAGTSDSPQIAAGAIVDADIAAAAAIMGRKLNWSVGVNPPGSPSPGDLWIYPGSGFYWVFIYDNAEATYKWKFIGGGDFTTFSTGAISGTTTATWAFYAGGLTLTLPRSGDYAFEWACRGQAGAASGATDLAAGLSVNSTTGSWIGAVQETTQGSSKFVNLCGCCVSTGRTAGDVIRMITFQNSGAACPFDFRAIKIRPIRII